MKNFERYKTIDEQIIAHERYCKKHAKYGDCKNCIECALRWIFLEAEEELKPCPFCGGEAKCYNLSTNNDPAHYTITCTECWASIPAGDSEEETTNRWNRRTGQ